MLNLKHIFICFLPIAYVKLDIVLWVVKFWILAICVFHTDVFFKHIPTFKLSFCNDIMTKSPPAESRLMSSLGRDEFQRSDCS